MGFECGVQSCFVAMAAVDARERALPSVPKFLRGESDEVLFDLRQLIKDCKVEWVSLFLWDVFIGCDILDLRGRSHRAFHRGQSQNGLSHCVPSGEG